MPGDRRKRKEDRSKAGRDETREEVKGEGNS